MGKGEAPAAWWGEERSGPARIKQSGGLFEVTSAGRASDTPVVGVKHGWGAAPINSSGGRIEMSNADFARNSPGMQALASQYGTAPAPWGRFGRYKSGGFAFYCFNSTQFTPLCLPELEPVFFFPMNSNDCRNP